MTHRHIGLLIAGVALTAAPVLPQRLPRWRPVPDLTARFGAAAAYDEARGRVVMFGGMPTNEPFGASLSLDDTWEWNGRRWLPRQPRTVPRPRHGAALAYDPVRARVVMFGGVDVSTGTALSELWEWDGEDWRRITPTNSPPPLLAPSFAVDPVRRRIVLFGGKTQLGQPGPWLCLDDTWEWDGTDWTLVQPSTRPSPRFRAGMAYCARTRTIVMYGGTTTSSALVGDRLTWEWDGTDWRSTPAFPTDPASGGRAAPSMVPLPWSGDVLLSGETSSWAWNGSTWRFVESAGGAGRIPVLLIPACATDLARQQVVCFGGLDPAAGFHPRRVTWVFDQSGSWREVAESMQSRFHTRIVRYDSARDEYLFLQWDDRVPGLPMRTARMRGATLESEMEEYSGLTQVPWRAEGGMCFDPVSGKMLLFGGAVAQGVPLNDTWLWDGRDWVRPSYTLHPPHGIGVPVFDSRRRVVVMPTIIANQRLATWEWTDALGWRQLPHVPSAYFLAILGAAYAPATDQVVVVARQPTGSAQAFHTWTYDRTGWREHVTATTLPNSVNAVIHVPELDGVIAFGIQDGVYGNPNPYELWLWTGTDWQRTQTANAPGGPRVYSGVPVYDSSRGKVRLFRTRGSGWFCEDLIIDRLTASSHGPRIGSTWTAHFDDPSQAGRYFALALSGNDWPALPLRYRPALGVFERFPLGDDPLLSACAAAGFGVGALDAQGRGSFPIVLPNHNALVGYRFHAAALTFDPTLPAFGVVSNPLTMEIQR